MRAPKNVKTKATMGVPKAKILLFRCSSSSLKLVENGRSGNDGRFMVASAAMSEEMNK
jgi:hypothetical protein